MTARMWSYSAGERGRNRVRVFTNRCGVCYVEWYEPNEHGRPVPRRMSLGHRDRQRARREADRMATMIGEGNSVPVYDRLTLRQLFDNYQHDELVQRKSPQERTHDRRAIHLLLTVIGPQTPVMKLGRREWNQFIAARRDGLVSTPSGQTRAVGERVIAQDLKVLRTALRWAVGARLIPRDPLDGVGVRLPANPSPNRPVMDDATYQALLLVAPRIDWRFEVALVLAHETGHRINAIRLLRWSDLDLDRKTIQWRAEMDKTGREHMTPLTSRVVGVLEQVRRTQGRIGDGWLLPSPRQQAEPVSRKTLHTWFRTALKRTGEDKQPGLGWHSLRRKFATDLKSAPLKDVMELGGWRSQETVLAYQATDVAAMREVLARRQPTHKSTHRAAPAQEVGQRKPL